MKSFRGHDFEGPPISSRCADFRRAAASAAASGSNILRSSNRLTGSSRGGSFANTKLSMPGSSKWHCAVSVTPVPNLGRFSCRFSRRSCRVFGAGVGPAFYCLCVMVRCENWLQLSYPIQAYCDAVAGKRGKPRSRNLFLALSVQIETPPSANDILLGQCGLSPDSKLD